MVKDKQIPKQKDTKMWLTLSSKVILQLCDASSKDLYQKNSKMKEIQKSCIMNAKQKQAKSTLFLYKQSPHKFQTPVYTSI